MTERKMEITESEARVISMALDDLCEKLQERKTRTNSACRRTAFSEGFEKTYWILNRVDAFLGNEVVHEQ